MKKDKLSGADKFYGYSTERLIARTKKEKKALKDYEKSLPKPLDHLTSEEIESLPFFSYHREYTPEEIKSLYNRYEHNYYLPTTSKRPTTTKKKKKAKLRLKRKK